MAGTNKLRLADRVQPWYCVLNADEGKTMTVWILFDSDGYVFGVYDSNASAVDAIREHKMKANEYSLEEWDVQA